MRYLVTGISEVRKLRPVQKVSSALTHPDLVLTFAFLIRYLPHRFISHLLTLAINPPGAQDLGFPPLLKPFVVQSSLGALWKESKSLLMRRPLSHRFLCSHIEQLDFTDTSNLSLKAM